MKRVPKRAGRVKRKLVRNLSRICTPWVRVAAMVVSEMTDMLSPNMAPPTTAPSIHSMEMPLEVLRPRAKGVTVAMVPQLVPMASEMKQEEAKMPRRMRWSGMRVRARITAASMAPMDLATAEKMPARMKTRHMIMMLVSPMPLAKASILSLMVRVRFCMMAKAEATRKAIGIGTA